MSSSMSDEIKRCPKCGYPNVYIGATRIECGYIKNCENYTKTQAKEVQKFLKEKFPSAAEMEDLDWGEDEDITQPYRLPLPGFGD